MIPRQINPDYKMAPSHFTRNVKLPFPKLIVFILSIAASGKSKGVDSKSGAFFKNARRSGLWPDAEAIHRSTLTKARNKVTWKIFENIFHDAVKLAYGQQPHDSGYLWNGMPVFAFDGSKYDLPAADAVRKRFDPDSGLENPGRGHYPQALISTAYDVFRRIPVARTVVGMQDANEREEAKRMIPYIPEGGVLLFDRGYPSYDLIHFLKKNHTGHFLFRCPAQSTFPAVEKFVRSDKNESVIHISPSANFLKKADNKKKSEAEPIKQRVIKLVSPDGTVSVLLTDLYDMKKFSAKLITELYFRRWEVENHYRDEKIFLEIEKFHTRTVNGVLQELFAVLIMTVISKTLMQLSLSGDAEPQFKNAVMALADEAAVLIPSDPQTAVEIFKELSVEIARVKYYRPKSPRPSQPRVTKRPASKWCKGKAKKSRSP
ncbi:MAG: IS4 family transposase [bacterium]|nr:IS4 family transposase [bacterium]